MGHSRPLFFYFRLFNTVNSKCSINFCLWLDSNRGPLELEATALPTASQPLPWKIIYWISSWSFRPNYILPHSSFFLFQQFPIPNSLFLILHHFCLYSTLYFYLYSTLYFYLYSTLYFYLYHTRPLFCNRNRNLFWSWCYKKFMQEI